MCRTTHKLGSRAVPVELGSSGEDVSVMDVAGDRVAGCDPLAHLQLSGQVWGGGGAVAHLLIL